MIRNKEFRYRDGKNNLLRSKTELSIAKLLQYLSIDYEYDTSIDFNGMTYKIDFKTDKGFIEIIDNHEDLIKYNTLKPFVKIFGIGNAINIAKEEEIGSLSVFGESNEYGSIFIEDPSLSFDYAHILPLVEKCSVLHGHTASLMVEIIGNMRDNMVIDFGEAKRLVKDVIRNFDHKFFINRRYIIKEDDSYYRVAFDGPNGRFDITLPKHTSYILNGEATVENLANEIICLLMPKMPNNVEALGVYIYEGVSKGAHLISLKDV
ncbi:MAG: 6-carboxytetrahydropterin synthase [Candidatus Nitrosocaldaceae archaeon]